MSRNATATVDRGGGSTLGSARQRNTWIVLAIALGAALLLGIAGAVVTRDDVAIPRSPAPITQDQPGYTGDWKDSLIGGDAAKDSMVERLNEQPAYTGDWKDTFTGDGR